MALKDLLPWQTDDREDRRFWQILGWCMLPFSIVALVVPVIETPEPQREQVERLPPQLARVVLEEREKPEPEPPPEAEPEPEPKPEPEETAEAVPEEVPEEPVETVEQARNKAQQSGVLAFADELAQMRDSVDTADLDAADARQNNGEAAEVDRALIASRSGTRSGGVDTSELSRDTGGLGLSGRKTTRVENQLADSQTNQGEPSSASLSQSPTRTDEAIRKAIDRNKNAIFAIYNRALRRDPTLEGRVIIKMVIEPSGTVSAVQVVSSDLSHKGLESKILARVRMIDFGEEDVGTATLKYTFDFLPS